MIKRATGAFTGREWGLLGILLAVQFCHILDFVLIMPLGPMLMRSLDASAKEFGLLVSAYTFSAAITGLVASAYMDRFDRKRMLMVLLAGFGVGTLLCGLVDSYGPLMAARVVAGGFGGVLAGVVFAIVGDQIRPERRATAMGVVMGGFSAASVLGLPFGLSLAEATGWQTPFLVLAGVTGVILVLGTWLLPPMNAHLAHRREGNVFRDLVQVARDPEHVKAFTLTTAIMFSAFTVVPFLSPYLVGNVGMAENKLDLIYFAGGLATLVTGPALFGPLADRYGHARVFAWVAVGSILPIAVVTNLPVSPLWVILTVTTLMMIMASGRMISATALVTGVVHPARRGSFMSLNSSVQQGAAGLAASVGGLMIAGGGGSNAPITGYPAVGALAIAATLTTILLVRRLRPAQVEAAVPQLDQTGAPALAAPLEAPRRRVAADDRTIPGIRT
ncbi:MAG TPA: MFS transporter [Longimicrobium sp.]|jgi:predicted MFS family arabinose efflux permease|uniref:MFS transporter n=1 Tax=Longimicrobium sp. TaxID=2029185 RepID=UPI002EDB9EAF